MASFIGSGMKCNFVSFHFCSDVKMLLLENLKLWLKYNVKERQYI